MSYSFAEKPYRESTGATNKKMADKIYRKRLDELTRGKHNIKNPENIKLFQLTEKYEHHSRKKKESHRTDTYRLQIIRNHFDDVSLMLITMDEIEEFYDFLLEEGRSKSTINRYNALLKNMFNLSQRWFDVPVENPTKYITKYTEVKRTRYLSRPELNLLLSEAVGHIKDLIMLALHTAGRLKELLNMKWSNVDFELKTITFFQYKTKQTITIPLLPALEVYLKQMNKECDYIIHFERKPILSPKKAFYNLVKKCGIDNFLFHDLRHTSATYLSQSGVSNKVIQIILGHIRSSTTDGYIHISQEYVVQEMQKLTYPIDVILQPDSLQDEELH